MNIDIDPDGGVDDCDDADVGYLEPGVACLVCVSPDEHGRRDEVDSMETYPSVPAVGDQVSFGPCGRLATVKQRKFYPSPLPVILLVSF